MQSSAITLLGLLPDEPANGLLTHTLSHYGYRFINNHTPLDLLDSLRGNPAHFLLIDWAFLEKTGTLSRLQKRLIDNQCAAKIIYTEGTSDLAQRLKAIRAGAAAYLPGKPSPQLIIETLAQLGLEQSPHVYKVLIIEDSPTQARIARSILEQAGFTIAVIHDPEQALHAVEEFRPDLILTDLYMPFCSGLELAHVLRQQALYAHLPIVFLSMDAAQDAHLTALDIGADDFLTKPIQAEHLIRIVTARIQRAKKLQALIEKDSLTGLLNHAAILERLLVEQARSQRESSTLSFVMLDLDYFKQINDSYGHATGDHVLKNLAIFLQNRLRKTDAIGRYGGEEFALILPQTTAKQAYTLINQLREDFSRMPFAHQGVSFQVTFSAGIAEIHTLEPDNSLAETADKRLYAAKAQGRNCVVYH